MGFQRRSWGPYPVSSTVREAAVPNLGPKAVRVGASVAEDEGDAGIITLSDQLPGCR